MVIKIHEIGPDGRSLSLPFEPSFFARAFKGEDIQLGPGGAGADVTLHKLGENVLLRGRMRGRVTVPCARCLAPAAVDVSGPLNMTYSPESAEMAEAKLENPDEDVDFSTFDGETIDLGELFREQILLAIPMTPHCREDCKGLCPSCGQDWNEGLCTCERPTDPRFSALKGLKLN
jgi:uncharacterized protein